MSTFSIYTEPQTSQPLQPFKHVNYKFGMVLGVDDLQQEFAFHSGQNHWLTFSVLGYGTTNGLALDIEVRERDGETDIELIVQHGTAISPQGQLIRLDEAQCARLNRWINANRAEVIRRVGSPPATELVVYVVLSYRECPTDEVLIPGEPCRDESDSYEFSRLSDDFRLELVFDAPEQIEYDAMRAFLGWWRGIDWIVTPDTPVLRADFAAGLLSFNDTADADVRVPPPAPAATLTAPRAAADAYLQLALRLWVTEIRPRWLGTNADASGLIPSEARVLLGMLTLPLTNDLEITGVDAIELNEEDRPILAPLQLLQHAMVSQYAAIINSTGIAAPTPLIRPVAAGRFGRDGTTAYAFANLQALPLFIRRDPVPTFYYLIFDGFIAGRNFIVKGTPIVGISSPPHTFATVNTRVEERPAWLELLESLTVEARTNLARAAGLGAANNSPNTLADMLLNDPRGIMVRVQPGGELADGLGFDVEISVVES